MAILNIAIQKSGRLNDDTLALLKDASFKFSINKNHLKSEIHNFPAQLLHLRNSDIPEYVEDGVADVAIIGYNTAFEKNKDIQFIRKLNFSKCHLSIAGPKNIAYSGPQSLEGKRIATSYPHTLQHFLDQHKVNADIHHISGSVEIAPNIGLADFICDLVSSGNTLFVNNLQEYEIILNSEAYLISHSQLTDEKQALLDQLVFRLDAVLQGRKHKYVMMNVPNTTLDQVCQVLSGLKSPTIVPLANKQWSAVQTVVSKDEYWNNITEVKRLGAEDILVLPIEEIIP